MLLTLDDYAAAAQARLSGPVWDYLAGGAGDERTLAANRDAFAAVRILPSVLAGAGIAETQARILGGTFSAPIGIAPCAYHTLAHPDGELATARAAGAAGVPFIRSMYSGRSLKQVGAAAADAGAVWWQQLYCHRDRSAAERIIRLAEDEGTAALVLTVDTPHLGRRLRDLRNGFRLPPGIAPADFDDPAIGSPADHARSANDAALDWSVVDWLRDISGLPILLKGLLRGSDALRAVDAGVDGVIVSNHGGRQLDTAPATLEALPAIAAAVAGRASVLLDGGVRAGTDVLTALALGADAVLVGRPVLHGLTVDGELGAQAVLDLLREELRDAMTLAGIGAVEHISPDLIDTSRLAAIPHAPTPPVAIAAPALPLTRASLHSSLSDPDLDSMAFLNEIADRYPDAVSFAPGRPYDGFFEVEDVFASIRTYLDSLAASGRSEQAVRSTLYQYGPSAGIIRDLIAQTLLLDEEIEAPPESIVVTVGAQEAMLLVLRALFADPRDVLLVATPCYVGIVGAAKLLGLRIATIAERPVGGLHPEDVVRAIEQQRRKGLRPRALYVIPDHANPSGNTIDLAARHALIEVAARQGVLLLEDSPYRLVSPGERLPTLKALDRGQVVVHIGSFAKSMFPGARVGYVVADQPVDSGLLADELARIKSMVTVNTSALSQAAVAGTLIACGGRLAELNARAAAYYGENLEALADALEEFFPATGTEPATAAAGPKWNRPQGGFFLTLDVPFRADDAALDRSAREFGVLWTPMAYFYPGGGGERQLRLSFSGLTPARIREGVGRLARFIASESARSAGA